MYELYYRIRDERGRKNTHQRWMKKETEGMIKKWRKKMKQIYYLKCALCTCTHTVYSRYKYIIKKKWLDWIAWFKRTGKNDCLFGINRNTLLQHE